MEASPTLSGALGPHISRQEERKKGPPLDSSKLNASNSKRSTAVVSERNALLDAFFSCDCFCGVPQIVEHITESLFCSIMIEGKGKWKGFKRDVSFVRMGGVSKIWNA